MSDHIKIFPMTSLQPKSIPESKAKDITINLTSGDKSNAVKTQDRLFEVK